MIRKAHRLRKVFGGGMRQAGVLAAAALYALEHNVERLAEDHAHAQVLARAVEATAGLWLESGRWRRTWSGSRSTPALGTAIEVAARREAGGVLVSALGPQVLRACTHLDVSREQAEHAAERILAWRERRSPGGQIGIRVAPRGDGRAVSFSTCRGKGDWLAESSERACPPFLGKMGRARGTGTFAALRSQSPLPGPESE